MAEYLFARTTRFLKSIRENREPAVVQRAVREEPLLVGSLGEADHYCVVPGQPGGVEGDGAEGVAEDVTEEVGNGLPNLRLGYLPCLLDLIRVHSQQQRFSPIDCSRAILCGVALAPC